MAVLKLRNMHVQYCWEMVTELLCLRYEVEGERISPLWYRFQGRSKGIDHPLL